MADDPDHLAYDPDPRYSLLTAPPIEGYAALADRLAPAAGGVVALDGPASLPWPQVTAALRSVLEAAHIRHQIQPVHDRYVPWAVFELATESERLRDDPDFARLPEVDLGALVPASGRTRPTVMDGEVLIVAGPGSALVDHDECWLLEHTREEAARAVAAGEGSNLGRPLGDTGTWRRLAFVDWPVMETHWAALLAAATRYVDLTDPRVPRSASMAELREAMQALARRPFRTRPTSQPGVWGGQWLKQLTGRQDTPNLAWSYELIAPESDVTFGQERPLHVSFALLLLAAEREIMGEAALARFGRSFPIRMDYLDTVEGQPLSAHCHPQQGYAEDVFGLAYTQHESYYVMQTRPGAEIFLGLRDGADPDAFRAAVEAAHAEATPLSLEQFAAVHPARQHQLYLVPAGTLHASGQGNVVLEISSTPYLYSLRFYDWLRRDLDGTPRPIHADHAFANLDPARSGPAVDALIPHPAAMRACDGGVEVELGRVDGIGLHVRRLEFAAQMDDDTAGTFHVLNVAEGNGVQIESGDGVTQRLGYAETALVPASVGPYRLVGDAGAGPFKVVKALIGA